MKLRDYQIEIAHKATAILQRFGLVYLAMEVRTGKTLTSLAICQMVEAKSVLFVTKKKAIPDIIDQAKSFLVTNIYVTNYDQLHNVNGTYDVVVVDEAHSIGAFPTPSVRAKELKRICGDSMVIYLSGTPTPESWSQIYHQFWISDYSPFKEYKNFYKWSEHYVSLKKKFIYNRSINDYSNANMEQIKEATKHLFISYTQEEAGFTEMVQENIVKVKMQDSTYRLADRLRIDKIVKNKEGEVVLGDTAVALMNKLHQIYSGTVIIDNPERRSSAFDYTKAEYIKEKFDGKKIAIFYKFVSEAYILQWVFGKCYTDPSEFASADSGVFISQIQSGREGINLSTAEALIFYNIDFSAVSYWQARARLQTKDRKESAQIYWVFSEGGIEEKIYQAVMNKKDYTLQHFKKDFLL